MKRILDTVHGYIMVGDEFINHIIDTPFFQRLRRIEQTSIRSVYPSARHDRFIHSLGVYHIGSLIVEHLKNEAKAYEYWGETETTMMVLYNSYLAACLLHDIAHAPFSHTFEHYYKKTDLVSLLVKCINNECFINDLNTAKEKDEPNFHEYMSAYIAYTQFYDGLRNRMNLDPEFVVRMITGVYYSTQKDIHQIHNCFISLLHGRVIDADRLDYACRDVWASGYSTSSIDLRRLISALHIMRNDNRDYVVCFESNSLNEIEGVLNVKDFQVKYVINHHVVCYEQWLLTMAAETMALKYYPREDNNGALALGNILNDKSITDRIFIPKTNFVIRNISDDDLIFLMKQDDDNPYYNQWYSRQYTHAALWKSKDEFYHFFKNIEKNKTLKHNQFEEQVKQALIKKFNITLEDIIVIDAVFKPRVQMNSLYLVVANDIVRYTDIYPEKRDINENIHFYYVFVSKDPSMKGADWINYRTQMIDTLKPIMLDLYEPIKETSNPKL